MNLMVTINLRMVFWVVLALAAVVVAIEIPDIQRYLRIRAM